MNHTTIFIVYRLTAYHTMKKEYNYLWSSGTGKDKRGVCFLSGMKAMRVHGAIDEQKVKTNYIDVTNF